MCDSLILPHEPGLHPLIANIGMIWYGMVWYGTVYGMVWYGMVWYGKILIANRRKSKIGETSAFW